MLVALLFLCWQWVWQPWCLHTVKHLFCLQRWGRETLSAFTNLIVFTAVVYAIGHLTEVLVARKLWFRAAQRIVFGIGARPFGTVDRC